MIYIFIAIFITLALGYSALMLVYLQGWRKQEEFVLPKDFIPKTGISIIIPARNEAHNITACISAILKQNYPKNLFDIIVVDDHSTDDTFNVINAFNDDRVRCIRLSEYLQADEGIISYKKKALEAGIGISMRELIITTDADCTASTQWLLHVAAIYEKENPVMIVAPVDFTFDNSVLQIFQSLDFMSMQGITAAAHKLRLGNMCNGANLAFTRKAYNSVNGYKDIDHLASGDDYLLMMKLHHAYPTRISYLKSKYAIVRTVPQLSWKGFLQQRIRWASKTGKYDDKRLTMILAYVYLFNLSFLVYGIAIIFHPWLILPWLFVLIIKTESELFYLFPVARFFDKKKQLFVFPLLQPLHIAYIITAGFMGFAGKYQWKGRDVK